MSLYNYSTKTFTINGRTYSPPNAPTAVICIDGCADEYLSTSMAHGCMPNCLRLSAEGYRGMVRGALPSFTNVNNCAVVTGLPPSETGIGGNFIIDHETGEEVMTNSSKYLRKPTILAEASKSGRKVAMVTAKDKLRELLTKDMHGIAFSSEKAAEATLEVNGIENVEKLIGAAPPIYSGEASLYVLRAGVDLIRRGISDFCYLTLTDFMQHKYAPSAPESLEFYSGIDRYIGLLMDLGVVIGITADHGMNAKCLADGSPNVIFLESELRKEFGDGIQVICPITDPYVVHHGALGSAVTVYLQDILLRDSIADWLIRHDGITEVYNREIAAIKLQLPSDRIGDLFVLSGRDVVLGRSPEYHDLTMLEDTLRSHGGRYEEMVPMLLSRKLNCNYSAKASADPRNFDIFDFVCNGGN